LAEKKGIRVNALAKELGVESKSILTKLKDEGLGDKAPNHMSVIPLGLAESVREWFVGAGGTATAVETAAPPVTKVKKARPSVRKKTDDEEQDLAEDAVTSVAPKRTELEEPESTEEEAAPATVAEEPAAVEAVEPPVTTTETVEVAVAVEPEVKDTAQVHDTTEVVTTAPVVPTAPTIAPPTPVAAPAPAALPARPGVLRPAASAPAVAPGRPGIGDGGRPAQRPTVTIGPSRGPGPAHLERKPVTVAPQLTTLQPAQIQGPKIIRVEKPDVVQTPGARRGPVRGPAEGPGYTTARPTTGRGVKVYTDEEEEAAKKAAAKGKAGSLSSRRRGVDGRRGEADEKLREFSEADLEERRIRLGSAATHRAAFERHLEKGAARGTHARAQTGIERGQVMIEEPITIKSLSGALGVKSNDLITRLMKQGIFANVNQGLDRGTAENLALDFGVELIVAEDATLEEELIQEFEGRERTDENLRPRPAVVAILGHVDHGKTSLLDKIRNANVAAGEAGGITQHTAAWQVSVGEGENKKQVTFIDTPGHQAFTSMRARGAQITDVVVLVVAAVEGVMPQTIESINHARAAGVPIVVALNKIDRPDANPDMVLGQLAAQGLNPIEYGGETEVVRTSAVTGQGIPELIEILDLQSQIMDLKADPSAPARGTIIEARIDAGLGPVGTALVQDGTLKVGDVILAGPGYGRIRSLLNDRGEQIQEAGPSTPVIISGLTAVPSAGDKFYVADDHDRARSIAEERATLARQKELAARNQAATDVGSLFAQMKAGQIKTINLIIKADVQGSVETLAKTVTDYNTDEVRIRVIHAAAGGITESDVELAAATKDVNESTVVIGFHVIADESARSLAERMHVEIRTYQVIYEIFDDLKKALSGMLEPEVREKLHGHAEVRLVFKVSKIGNIAGCFVTDGHIQRGSKMRLTRGGIVITQDLAIESLKRLKDDAREVKAGLECGIKLAGYDDIKVGDVLEGYSRETIQRTL
jgi:translation initiation factor IF-2